MPLNAGQRSEVARISKLVDDEQVMLGVADQVPDQRRSNKSRPTCYDDPHRFPLSTKAHKPSSDPADDHHRQTDLQNPSATGALGPSRRSSSPLERSATQIRCRDRSSEFLYRELANKNPT